MEMDQASRLRFSINSQVAQHTRATCWVIDEWVNEWMNEWMNRGKNELQQRQHHQIDLMKAAIWQDGLTLI